MQLSRGLLMNRLNEARIGLSDDEETEQSNVFVFEDGKLTTFNGEIMVRVDSPLDFDVIVNAVDLLALVNKIPDDEITIYVNDGELCIDCFEKDDGKSKKRKPIREYAITIEQQNNLPLGELPQPSKWYRVSDNVVTHMVQAARICSKEEDDYLTKLVHITPDAVEASDNDRFYRAVLPTGFPDETLIEAELVLKLKGIELTKVSFAEGWVYFKTSSGALIAVRVVIETYHDEIASIMEMSSAEKVTLPQMLKEMIERSQIFTTQDGDARITVQIEDGLLVLSARKENGRATERKPLAYKGTPLTFSIPPKFLVEMLERTRDVLIGDYKMKMTTDKVQFVVALDMPSEQE